MFIVIIVVIIILLIVKSIINEQKQKLLKEILMTLKLENIDTLYYLPFYKCVSNA